MTSARGTALALLLPVWIGTTTAASLDSLEQITECGKANLPDRSSVQTVTLNAVDRLGSENRSQAKMYWRKFQDGRSKVLIRIFGPPDVRGTSLLIIEREPAPDIFSYLPELDKVRRVHQRSVSGSFLGTDFTYEDFERLNGLTQDAKRKRLPDSAVDGLPVYVIEGRPSRVEDSAYSRIVSYLDQETCVAIRTDFFEKGDRLRKVMTAPRDQITKEASGYVPRLVRMENVIDRTHTELTLEEIEIDPEIPKSLFSERALQSRRR